MEQVSESSNGDNDFGMEVSGEASEITMESEKHTQTSAVSNMANSESQTISTQASVISEQYSSRNIRQGIVPFHVPNVSSVPSTMNSCFICNRSSGSGSRCRVPYSAVIDAWIQKRIFVPPKNRCCKSHVAEGLFTLEAFQQIKATKSFAVTTGIEMSKWMHVVTDQLLVPKNLLDFEPTSRLTDKDFDMLLGLSKLQFEELFKYVSSDLRNTKLRYCA